MLFNSISRVFFKYNTTYKVAKKDNNTIKYNIPSNRQKGLNICPFMSNSIPNKDIILLFTPLFNILPYSFYFKKNIAV